MEHIECTPPDNGFANLRKSLRGGLIISKTLPFDVVLSHMNHLGVQPDDGAKAILSLIDDGVAAVVRQDGGGILQAAPNLKSTHDRCRYFDCLTFLQINKEAGHA
ncbi:hypothetical protein GFB49_11525 [Epibacterium sp. SM1979]|uniref:Uncharacterized protein n=1 Tax=Tritonibacter litoralis TaxID=2662264 RepID=A0A843YDG6_9RHOB|nr:hypothetical protein [Tritonibacter litoralis]MQQ09086.1 hypothetical protein [Tritonibacter litoralis]